MVGRFALRAPDLKSVRRWLPGAVLTLFTLQISVYVFVVFNDQFLHNGLNFDESYFLWCGWSILKGLAPYRDFIEFKPPLVFLTHALAIKLFGFEHFGYRRFFEYFPLSSLLALQLALVSRGIDRWLSLSLTLACIYLWVHPAWHDVALSDSESIGLSYYFLAVACLLARTRLGGWLQCQGGVFFVCTLLSKEPFLPCVGMTWISAFLLSDADARMPLGARAGRYAARTIGGGLVVVALLCIYMVPTGAMRAYLQMLHAYFRFFRDIKQSYCVVLGRFHPTAQFNDLHMEWRKARDEFMNSATLGYLAPFGAASVVLIFRRSVLLFVTVLIGTFAGLWAVTASNCQWNHYYVMTMSGLFFALAVGLDSLKPHFALMSRPVRAFLQLAFLGVVLTHLWIPFDAQRDLFGSRGFANFNSAEPVPGVFAAVANNTKPSDYIVTTGQPSLYMQVNRIAGIRESATDDEAIGYFEGDTDEQRLSGVREELLRTKPKLIILDPGIAGEGRKVRFKRALWTPYLEEFKYREISPRIWLRPD